MNATEMKQHVEAISTTYNWPRWPLLPVKNIIKGPFTEDGIGVIVASEVARAKKIRVFGINLFAVGSGIVPDEDWPVLGTYEDVEGLVDAGWVGD